jgi:hypothetical protein
VDCRVPQSCSLVMERPGPSSPEILSPENFSPVSGKVLDGRDGLLGCLTTATQFGRGKPAGGIRRYRNNGDGLSDGEYIFGRSRGR